MKASLRMVMKTSSAQNMDRTGKLQVKTQIINHSNQVLTRLQAILSLRERSLIALSKRL
jgi:hypothetical protein